jgi:hypothetical protein
VEENKEVIKKRRAGLVGKRIITEEEQETSGVSWYIKKLFYRFIFIIKLYKRIFI